MNPPGKTTLSRMQRSAQLEAERIEITQDARVSAGLQKQPNPDQVAKRDDFVGMVRLIDTLMSDQALLERFEARAAGMAAAAAASPARAIADAEEADDNPLADIAGEPEAE